MNPRLFSLVLAVASVKMFGQFDPPGLFGKITSHPKTGDLAPEISFTKVLHFAGSIPWTPGKLNGQVTVLMFLPYVSGNPDMVNRWNALVEQFAGTSVQFAWIAAEDERTLLPFLKEHPVQGWVFNDRDGATGRSYGLEIPQSVIVGAEGRIAGFEAEFLPRPETVRAILEDRKTTLSPEPRRMPRAQDNRPAFSPSYAVHITPSQDESGGNFSSMDYWSLKRYTVKSVLAELLDVSPVRIDLPPSIDTKAHYDFAIVLPKPEDRATMRSLMRQGVEDYFHLIAIRDNRLRDVYVLTASGPKLSASGPPKADGMSIGFSMGFVQAAGRDEKLEDTHPLEAATGVSVENQTMSEFCRALEENLDRPVLNETRIEGRFDFRVTESQNGGFVDRLREQLGLVIMPAPRNVETIVYRQR